MGKPHPVGYYHDDWIIAHHRAFKYWADFLNAYCSIFPGERSAVKMHCKRSLKISFDNPREDYHDDWILKHWDSEKNWNRLADRYNKEFGTSISYTAFKTYCNRKLELNFKYTKEQDEWLKKNYPVLGQIETEKQFNRTFNTNRSRNGIFVHCKKLGLKVNEERRKEWRSRIAEVRKQPLGTVREREHGTLYVKTEQGWKRQNELVLGKKKGQLITCLDGNKHNLSPSNLVHIDRKISAIMTAENFWSKNAEVTKSGIAWSKLKIALKERGIEAEI